MSARGIVGFLAICIGYGLTPPVCQAGEPQTGRPAQAPKSAAQPKPVSDKATDLAYGSEDGFGLMIFRPAAFFQLPGTKSLVGTVNGFVAKDLLHLVDPKKLTLSIDSIEQVTTEIVPRKTNESVVFGGTLRVIHITEPFDWKKQFQALASEVEPPDYVMANDRTIVLEPEAKYRHRQSAPPPKFTCCPGWKEVENCMVVCVLNNARSQWIRELGGALKDLETEPDSRVAAQSISDLNYVIIGVDISEGIVVKAFLDFKTDQAARSLFDLYEASLPAMRKALQEAGEPKIDNEAEKAIVQAEKDLVHNASVRREGSVITLRSTAKLALADPGVQRALASLIASR